MSISTKLGWGNYIQERLRIIRKIYKGLRAILRKIPLELMHIRRKVFTAYALPHFSWLFCTWFFFTENQQRMIEHTYCSGLRIVYSIRGWDDLTTMIPSREKSLNDYIFSYWTRLGFHLERAADALSFQQSWQAFQIITSPDGSWLRSMGFRKNSKFPNRLIERAQHSLRDWRIFQQIQKEQYEHYKRNTLDLNNFIYKYFLLTS